MKVTLDLDDLRARGELSQAEYDKLARLSRDVTGMLAFNLLVGFGIVAVSGALLALVPTPWTALWLGLGVVGIGLALTLGRAERWGLLAQLCIAVGALAFAGGVVLLGEGSARAFLLVAAVTAAAGVAARTRLLIVLGVLALASTIGARTGYFHAAYFLGVEEPALTILLFSLFGALCWLLSRQLPTAYATLAQAAAATAVFLVNLGFWVGSLWGDRVGGGLGRDGAGAGLFLPDWAFALGWACALLIAGVWAWRRQWRWLLNLLAVFAGIHFYTQWFERLGAAPGSVLAAGLITLAVAVGLRILNLRLR